MLILSETTDNLQVVLGSTVATNQLQCMSSWRDRTSTTFVAGRTIINTNNTTDVNVVGAPSASTQRVIDYLSVFNNDTATSTVTIKLDANGTEVILFRATIASGEKIEYQEGQGFQVLATNGSLKTSLNQGAPPPNGNSLNTVILASDVTNNNAVANTIQDVTGLSASFLANKMYYFRFVIWYQAAATTTGSRWSVRADAGLATFISYVSEYSLTTTSATRNIANQAFDSPAASNATSATTQSNLSIIEGYFTPTADCNFIARFASEVANSAITAKAGSVLYFQQLTP
jgi:hypothetical protein